MGRYIIFKLFYECTCPKRATHECIPDTLTIIATSFRSFYHPAIFHTFVAPWPQNYESISGQPAACRSTRTSPVALQGVPRVQHPPFFSRRCNSLGVSALYWHYWLLAHVVFFCILFLKSFPFIGAKSGDRAIKLNLLKFTYFQKKSKANFKIGT